MLFILLLEGGAFQKRLHLRLVLLKAITLAFRN